MNQEDFREQTQENSGQQQAGDGDVTLSRPPRPPIARKPTFPANLEGPRSKLIGILAETFEGVIPESKDQPQFDSWILIFGENIGYNSHVVNAVLRDERMLFPVLDTILNTTDLDLLEQKWLNKANPTKFIINARFPSGKIESSALEYLVNFIESKKRSWTERIYIIISTTIPEEAFCNGFAGRFKKCIYVPCPTEAVSLKLFAKEKECYDPFDMPVNEDDEKTCSEKDPSEEKGGCCTSLFNACFICLIFFTGD